jgi:hypothetical protein
MIPLNTIINPNDGLEPWKSISYMQFGISESNYADGTKLTFYLDDISLISFKTPVIDKIKSPATIVLPAKNLYCQVNAFGTAFVKQGEYIVAMKLINASGSVASSATVELKNCDAITLTLDNLKQGAYVLGADIVEKSGKSVSTWNKKINVIAGIIDK